MDKITFQCETVTPLILGAATKGSVELRPPAIKAALRFWWRAMHAHLTLKELKEREIEIFGGGGESARSSAFSITINTGTLPIEYEFNKNKNEKPIDIIGKDSKKKGVTYLIYSLIHLKKSGFYYPVGSTFEISFYFNNKEIQQDVVASFWMLVQFGNIGERARRGLGGFKVTSITDSANKVWSAVEPCLDGFKVTSITDKNENPNILYFIDVSEVSIKTGLTTVKNYFNPHNIALQTDSFSHFYHQDYYFSKKSFTNWQEALDDIGMKMKSFRLENRNGQERSILKDNASASFGLPIQHRNYKVIAKMFTRRSSPILVKITKLNDNFKWLVISLDGDFLPNNSDNLLKVDRNINIDIAKVNLKTLDDFIQHILK